MPTSDLDMPLLPSAEQISRREFATIRRGYDPQQVRAYLASIATQVGTLERELSQLRLEAGSAGARSQQGANPANTPDAAPPPDDPYDALSKRFASLIEMADQEAERILENARSDATRTLDEATSEADRIRSTPSPITRKLGRRGPICWSGPRRNPTGCSRASPTGGRRW